MLKKSAVFILVASVAACVCFTFSVSVTPAPKNSYEGFSKATKPKKKAVVVAFN
jgi:hypothetical protein